jgi:hypothetical protein
MWRRCCCLACDDPRLLLTCHCQIDTDQPSCTCFPTQLITVLTSLTDPVFTARLYEEVMWQAQPLTTLGPLHTALCGYTHRGRKQEVINALLIRCRELMQCYPVSAGASSEYERRH